jgi:hypothetical protein
VRVPLGGVHRLKRTLLRHETPDQCADDLVGVAERHALGDQVVGHVGRQQQTRSRGAGHASIESDACQDRRGRVNRGAQGVLGLEQRLLVFLQILAVPNRQALHRGQPSGQAADDPAGLAAHQFQGIRVLLLRHQAAAGRGSI